MASAERSTGVTPPDEGLVAPEGRTLNASRMRDLIPATGLREYWYPLLPARKIRRRKPVALEVVGTKLALFRGPSGAVVAVGDACPHRGAPLSEGRCHFQGTLTCPYHGWTFDGEGGCIAVLGEGPSSRIPGMAGARARTFPTRTLKGIVFAWLGENDAAPIEQDVPPQFFDDSLVQNSYTEWDCNWRPAFENLLDAHVFYVHRNSVELSLLPYDNFLALSKLGPRRPRPHVVNDRGLMYNPGQLALVDAFVGAAQHDVAEDASAGDASAEDASAEDESERNDLSRWPDRNRVGDAYPTLGGVVWPKMHLRLVLHRGITLLRRALRRRRTTAGMITDPEWRDAHLPATYQVDYGSHIYTRTTVPIDGEHSRIFYFHTTRGRTPLERLASRIYFRVFKNWSMNYQFSGQDRVVVENQRYDTPEKLSATDAFPLALRRLIVEKARDDLYTSSSNADD